MGTITYFLNRPFVIILILGFSFFYLFMTLYICSTFLLDKFGMFSLILTMSLMLLLEASVYKQLPLAKISDKDILLLQNFDFSKTFLLGLEGIGGGILNTLVLLPDLEVSQLALNLLPSVLALNYKTIYCLNNLLSLFVVSLSQPDLQIDKIKSHAEKPNSAI